MQTNKKDFIWNMLGSLANAASSMLLLMFIGRAQGDEMAGVFSIAWAISSLAATIGLFEVRTYQSSDLKEHFKFRDYFTLRIITCLLMIIFCIGYVFINDYNSLEVQSILLICLYKVLDSFSDVFYGLFQQKNCLAIAGKSLFFRTVTCTIAFLFSVYYFDNLIFPCIILNIISLFWIIVYDFTNTLKFKKDWLTFNISPIVQLFIECLPLCICSFISIYLINSPKYAIDTYGTNTIQGIFGYIFMPTSVINLFSIFVLRPIIADLAISWNEKNKQKFLKIVYLVTGWIFLLTLLALGAGYLIGIPILSWFYATDLSLYKAEFLVILLGGGFSALTTAFYYILTVMRKQKRVLFTYLAAFPITWFMVPFLTNQFGMMGASIGYMLAMLILAIGLFVTMSVSIKKGFNTK